MDIQPVKVKMRIPFLDEEGMYTLEFGTYANGGGISIQIYGAEGPVVKATVNPDDPAKLGELVINQVVLKGWRENEGIPEELERVGIVSNKVGYTLCGNEVATVHQLKLNVLNRLRAESKDGNDA